LVERLLQPFSLPQIGVQRAMVERVDPARHRVGILMDEQFHPRLARGAVTERVHVAELPGRIDMEERERRRRRIEGLLRQVQHHRAVLADRIEHHGTLGLRHHFAQDVDTLRFQPLQVRERRRLDQVVRRGQRPGRHASKHLSRAHVNRVRRKCTICPTPT